MLVYLLCKHEAEFLFDLHWIMDIEGKQHYGLVSHFVVRITINVIRLVSGSLLVACAHFGSYVMGTDIDYPLLHAKGNNRNSTVCTS